jgi:hypothetical protein
VFTFKLRVTLFAVGFIPICSIILFVCAAFTVVVICVGVFRFAIIRIVIMAVSARVTGYAAAHCCLPGIRLIAAATTDIMAGVRVCR